MTPHGTPDWGLMGPKQTVYGLDDVGEAAVRMGSPVLWDRRGDVILMDSFEEGMTRPYHEVLFAGQAFDLVTDYPADGPLCVRLTTDADETHSVALLYNYPSNVVGYLGWEFWFSTDGAIQIIEALITSYSGVDFWSGVQLDLFTNRASYLDPTNNWVEFTDIHRIQPGVHYWYVLKYVVDSLSGAYERCIFNHEQYSMKGLTARVGAPGVQRYTTWSAGCYPVDTFVGRAQIDRLIATQNEPV